jgi:hypothetical protein
MAALESATERDTQLVRAILDRACNDLAMIIDRDLVVGDVSCERSDRRLRAPDQVHLSFRIEFRVGKASHQGCLLVPLPDAIAIALYLMVMPDETVKARRGDQDLDRPTKDAMLEVSNFIGGSADQVLREWKSKAELSARSGGCQGVAGNAVPNFRHVRGEELVIARIEMTLHDYPSFRAIMMLPAPLTNDE